MNIQIENPLEVLLEFTYLNGTTVDKKLPELISEKKEL